MPRFDWRDETILGLNHRAISDHLHRFSDVADMVKAKPMHGYEDAAEIRRGDDVLCRIWWGGNKGTHVQSSGSNAPWLVSALDSLAQDEPSIERRVTRTDACKDFIDPSIFDRFAGILLRFAESKGITIDQQGDWHRGKARTLYLGARSSAGQLVLYEKGYQMNANRDWVRLEARAYPKKEARKRVAYWQPIDVFGATRWMSQAMHEIGYENIEGHSIGTVRVPSDFERAQSVLMRQYRGTLQQWAKKAGGWHQMAEEMKAWIQFQDGNRF